MENIYCKDLNVPFNLDQSFIDGFNTRHSLLETCYEPFPLNLLDQKFVNWLATYNLSASDVCEFFFTPPGGSLGIHMDALKLGTERCRINWVYGAELSTMTWFDLIDPLKPLNRPTVLNVGSPFITFSQSDCKQVWAAHVGQPSLVNAGIPHSITNLTDKNRYCFSFELAYADTFEKVRWSDAVNILKDCIIN